MQAAAQAHACNAVLVFTLLKVPVYLPAHLVYMVQLEFALACFLGLSVHNIWHVLKFKFGLLFFISNTNDKIIITK